MSPLKTPAKVLSGGVGNSASSLMGQEPARASTAPRRGPASRVEPEDDSSGRDPPPVLAKAHRSLAGGGVPISDEETGGQARSK